jgi:hypothetical protein
MPFHLRLPSCWTSERPSVLGVNLGRSLVVGMGLRLRLEGGNVRCKGLLIGVWRWMRGCPISMLLGGLGYRGIRPASLLIRCGSIISMLSAEEFEG